MYLLAHKLVSGQNEIEINEHPLMTLSGAALEANKIGKQVVRWDRGRGKGSQSYRLLGRFWYLLGQIEYNNFNKIHAECVRTGQWTMNVVRGSLLASYPVRLVSILFLSSALSDWRRVNDNQVISIMRELAGTRT